MEARFLAGAFDTGCIKLPSAAALLLQDASLLGFATTWSV